MKHPRRIIFHFGLLEIEIFRLIISDPDLKTAVVVNVRASRGSARWPEKKNRTLQLYERVTNMMHICYNCLVTIIILHLLVIISY